MKQTYEELLQRNAELEKNIRVFESVISQSPASIVITNEKGTIEYVNEAFYLTFGYHEKELNEDFMQSVLQRKGSLLIFQEIKNIVMGGNIWRGELKEKRKDGKDVWIKLVVFPIFNDGRFMNFVAIITDITDQKLADEITREQQNLYKTLIENLPLEIAIYDKTGKFIYANEKTSSFFRKPKGSVIGKTFHELFPKDTADAQHKVLQHLFKTGKPMTVDRSFEMHHQMAYFRILHQPLFNEKGEVSSVLVIGENVTAQERQANLLRIQHRIDSLSNLSTSLSSSLKKAFQYLLEIDWVDGGGIYLFDDDRKTLKLVFSTGLSENYIKRVSVFDKNDKPAQEILKGKTRLAQTRSFLEPIKNVMIREKLTYAVSIPLIYKKEVIGSLNLGSRGVEEISKDDSLIIESIASRLANLIVLVKTREQLLSSNLKLNRSLNELAEQQHMLIQKSRLESLGELSAGLAHEINQPLSVISLVMENINLKQEQLAVTDEYLSSKFSVITQNVNKVRQLIDHVRIFSRDHGKVIFERIEINKVILNALSMMQTLLVSRQIKVKIKLSRQVLYTIGNPSRFEQVILNLLSNAKDALWEKERQSGSENLYKEIIISSSVLNNRAIITVRDNGTGISEANLHKLYIPFFTTKTDGMGTGLGLAIVYGILREMEGDIIASSQEGIYTEMKISLPHYKKIVDKK